MANNAEPWTFRWLGAAGIELSVAGQTLLVDPYLTRFGFVHQWLGRVRSDETRVGEIIQRCKHVLVTHSHWDHLMDVPAVISRTRAIAYGSPNTCSLLRLLGVPDGSVRQISVGQALDLGRIAVRVHRGRHAKAPGFNAGELRPHLHPPLCARDYRMDEFFAFHIAAGGISVMTDTGADPRGMPEADMLLMSPRYASAQIHQILDQVRPRAILPCHWDSMYRPITAPLKPMLRPPSRSFPFFGRMDLREFTKQVAMVDPSVRVLVVDALRAYGIGELVQGARDPGRGLQTDRRT
jgi:L-ascorbate metabolism protein UlaG (beta-lactamase superfamily)